MSVTATHCFMHCHFRRLIRRFVLAPALLAVVLASFGGVGTAQAGTMINQTDNGVAIEGYDPVAYFTMQRPVMGSDAFAHNWLGATWHFSKVEHRDLFVANPAKYAPQYGGYCAGGLALGHTAVVDPEAWHIVDGKLYLLYSKRVLKSWEKNIPLRVAEADHNWQRIRIDLTR